jgi:4-methyl-5(b-hydroxyethyl)-thiazole monophosphate biosynthesis
MKKVLLLLADGFEIYEASAYIDVMGWNLLEGDRSTKLYTCGIKNELTSTFGQKFITDLRIDEVKVEEFAAIALPGGFEEYGFYNDAFSAEFSQMIVEFERASKPISSICTGAFPIAKSGILRGRRGTTYNLNPKRQSQLADLGVVIDSAAIVRDGNITTSWNPSTALDVALHLLADLTTQENSDHVRKLMGLRLSKSLTRPVGLL